MGLSKSLYYETYRNVFNFIVLIIISADVAAKVLDRKICVRGLDETKHSKWFQTNISPVPSAVIALRVLSHVTRKEEMDHWRSTLKPWTLHVLVGEIKSKFVFIDLCVLSL